MSNFRFTLLRPALELPATSLEFVGVDTLLFLETSFLRDGGSLKELGCSNSLNLGDDRL